MTSELSDFIYDELLPRVLENMDTIFPERNWVKKGYRWSSPYHADGSESQSGARERSYIKTDSSKRFNVGETDGGSGMSLINYALIYKGYARNASGQDFIETVKWLCQETDLQMPEYNRNTRNTKSILTLSRRCMPKCRKPCLAMRGRRYLLI